MKMVQRTGAFETNSSSLHTLILTKKDKWEEMKAEKPKYNNFTVLTDAKDKLYLACGCCTEIFSWEEYMSEEERAECEEMRMVFRKNIFEFYSPRDFSCELAVELLVRGYCNKAGEDFDTVLKEITEANTPDFPCHLRFFEEEELDEPYGYYVIENLFLGGVLDGEFAIMRNIADYFDEDNLLCYREYWNGIGYLDDQD